MCVSFGKSNWVIGVNQIVTGYVYTKYMKNNH